MGKVSVALLLALMIVPPVSLFIWQVSKPRTLYPLPQWVRDQGALCGLCNRPATRSLRNISASDLKVTWGAGDPIFYCDVHAPGAMTDRGGEVVALAWGRARVGTCLWFRCSGCCWNGGGSAEKIERDTQRTDLRPCNCDRNVFDRPKGRSECRHWHGPVEGSE